ncbi:hypothetical protein D9C73_008055 [Collichthys lucidus]|uniref:Uncharacterized protein n=1 Tax=Collichthys lucidus TaxID=240159 RepID=A0A4U5UGX4_COLLU|nr:hypothetical protein D9C73_008055 [Collichthys lucidus]
MHRNMDNITVLEHKVDDITETMNRNTVTITGSMENIKNNQDMGYIIEKLTVLQRHPIAVTLQDVHPSRALPVLAERTSQISVLYQLLPRK